MTDIVEVNDSINSDGDGDFFPALDVSLLPKVRHCTIYSDSIKWPGCNVIIQLYLFYSL